MTISQEILLGGHGGSWAYFAKNQKQIGEFIRANAIEPSSIQAISAKAAPTAKALTDLGIPGGIRVAHLHFNDKIYMLNDKQWSQLSSGIISDCKAKLAKTKTLGFEQGILLGSCSWDW